MPEPIRVLDPGDDRLVAYRDLADGQGRRVREASPDWFVVEGRLALEQLLGSPYEVLSVLVDERRLVAVAGLLGAVRVPLYVAPAPVLAATVGFDLHRGIVAAARRPAPLPAAQVLAGDGSLLVVEGVNDHENLGALFRTARALGVTGVLLDPTCADPLYRRSIRVSLGHVLRLPFARLSPWPAALAEVAVTGRRLVALTPSGPHELGALGSAGPVALLVGAEGPGLSPGALAGADVASRIPMSPGVDSLNVATAAGIALHHLVPRVET